VLISWYWPVKQPFFWRKNTLLLLAVSRMFLVTESLKYDKPTKCAFSKLIFYSLIFDAFYMFRTRGFIFSKTVVNTSMV